MAHLTYERYLAELRALGVDNLEFLHVQSDLLRLGVPEATSSRAQILHFFWEGLREAAGKNCTISVSTAFEDFGYWGTPFDVCSSPSRTDALSEYVRTMPQSVRSNHPIVSVTANGPQAEWLCGPPHFNGFGYRSPWARLHSRNATVLSLGLDSRRGGTTFFHYVENLFGVPYTYTKLLSGDVYAGGVKLSASFTMSVRYLDFEIENSPVRIKQSLVASGLAREGFVGASLSWLAEAKSIVEHMCDLLERDRWVYLKRAPSFRIGEVPFDGPTGGLFTIDKL